MGWGGVVWGMSRLPTSLWGSTAGLYYERGKRLFSQPRPAQKREDTFLQLSRLLPAACWLYSGMLSGNASLVVCGRVWVWEADTHRESSLWSGPHFMGFPRGLGSRGLYTSASPIPLLPSGRGMPSPGREPRQGS